MNAILGVYTELDEVTNLQCEYLELLQKCECLEQELSKSKMMSKSFESVQKHIINLELELQQCKEKMKNDKSFKINQSKEFCKEREQYFEIQYLKAQLQDKGIAIRVISTTSVSRPQLKSIPMKDRVMLNNSQGKKHDVEDHRRNVKFSKNKTSVTACNDSLNAKTLNVNFVCATCGKCVLNEKHDMCVLKSHNGVNSRTKMPIVVPLVEIILFIVDCGCSKHMMGNLKLLINFVEKFLGTVKFGNDQIAPILGYGDLNDIVVVLSKLKFVKDHLCSSCELGKAKRKSFQSKTTPSSKRRLQLLHMDLCGPMRVASINGKRYVLVIVDDYSRYTLTHFLRSKDETPEVLIDFLRHIQRGLHAPVRIVRTDKGTEFLNQTLHAYFAAEGILHQTSVARTPEQNGVVERRNRTLVEAARTMLSVAKVSLFFWAEAIATSCFTQNRSLEKDDACIFVGYSTQSRAYRVFNKRTRVTVETIHVNLDELPQMASDHVSSDPVSECKRTALEHDSLSPGPQYPENVTQAAETGFSGTRSFVILIKHPTCLNDPLRTVLSVDTRSLVIIVKDVLFFEKSLRKDMFASCVENGILQYSFEPSNNDPNIVNAPREPFVVNQDPGKNSTQSLPQINHHYCYGCGDPLEGIFYRQCTCKLCGNGAHYGYNCLPKVSIMHNPEPFNNQTIKELPPTVQSFDPKSDLVHNSPNVFDPPPQLPFISFKFYTNDARYGNYCTPQVPFVYLEPCYNQDFNFPQEFQDFQNFQQQDHCCENCGIPACYDDDDDDYAFAITPNEPVNSLSMGDEHLDTISTTKSDEFIKSSVKNLVPNPIESEGENECDMPSFSDEDLPKEIYSNPLFDEEIIPMKIYPHHFNTESDIIESMINHDSSIIISSKIDSLFDEFAGELTLLKSTPPGIDETDYYPEEETHLIKRLLYDNSSPHPPEEFVSDNSDTKIESFSPSPIPVEDSDSLMEEIDLSFTLDYLMPPGIEDDDYDSERVILILKDLLRNDTLSLPEIESFHFDIPSFSRPPA
nr:hypothetical protein [Tanacetum cinerariifolium]